MTGFSDEQKLLQDSVARFVSDQYEFNTRRKILSTDTGYLPEHWAQFAKLGWLGAAFSEEDGGLGGSATDVAVIADELGKGLFVGPFYKWRHHRWWSCREDRECCPESALACAFNQRRATTRICLCRASIEI